MIIILIMMVFLFGLIHGFGLSTKLQEVAVESNISLSISYSFMALMLNLFRNLFINSIEVFVWILFLA